MLSMFLSALIRIITQSDIAEGLCEAYRATKRILKLLVYIHVVRVKELFHAFVVSFKNVSLCRT